MQDPLKFVLAAGIGTLLLVSLVVLRIYLVTQTNAVYNKREKCNDHDSENSLQIGQPLNSTTLVTPASTAGMELRW